jgi:hypothetical protein
MILVDPAVWPWRGRRWAHLASDQDYGELHDFAARLGLRRLAFQGDHYDVDEASRARALRAGARAVDARQLVGQLRRAGLRRRGPRQALRWEVVGEWSLGALAEEQLGFTDGQQPVGLSGAGAFPGGPGGSRPGGGPVARSRAGGVLPGGAGGLPVGGLVELLRAGGAVPEPDVALRVMIRPGEVAAVLARPGCDLPLPLPELVVERAPPALA